MTTFKNFLSVSIKTFEKGKKNSGVEVNAYCFDVLARAMII